MSTENNSRELFEFGVAIVTMIASLAWILLIGIIFLIGPFWLLYFIFEKVLG